MVVAAATLWAINGTVAKVILHSGVSTQRLAEVRTTGAFVGLAVALAVLRPGALRLRLRELPFLLAFGVLGLALVQWTYFAAIERLEIGIALLIQFIAPLLVALWARFVWRERVTNRIWAALVLCLAGLALVVNVREGVTLDQLGVAAALGAALSYAFYVLMAERGVVKRDPASLLCYGFLIAALFWAVLQPWWGFPGNVVGDSVSLLGNLSGWNLPVWLLMTWMVVLGTIAPFALLVGALRHISATRAGIVAMLEPVAGALVAYAWLDESLTVSQLGGGAVVLAGIVLAQTAR